MLQGKDSQKIYRIVIGKHPRQLNMNLIFGTHAMFWDLIKREFIGFYPLFVRPQ